MIHCFTFIYSFYFYHFCKLIVSILQILSLTFIFNHYYIIKQDTTGKKSTNLTTIIRNINRLDL